MTTNTGMEQTEQLQRIANQMSNKKPIAIRIHKPHCNDDGEMDVRLSPPWKPEDKTPILCHY